MLTSGGAILNCKGALYQYMSYLDKNISAGASKNTIRPESIDKATPQRIVLLYSLL